MSSADLLQIRAPKQWPDVPEWLTYSAVSQVEGCPRQWGLERGGYPDVWDQYGYPTRTNVPILRGRVIHRSVETILHAMRDRASSASPQAILEELGGYSAVIETEVEEVLDDNVFSNPRVQKQAADLESDLRESVGELRAKVQREISRLDEILSSVGKGRDQGKAVENEWSAGRRKPLSTGVYSEQWVQAPSIGWGGYIDLLSLSDGRCEIIDIKTGEPKESHADQVRLYALFWWLDDELNPENRAADVLQLRYSSESREVPALSEPELERLRQQVKERGREARSLMGESPPPARPEEERCNRCEVRHLCQAYWSDETQARFAGDRLPDFADVELRLTHNYATNMWYAQILNDGNWERGEQAILEAAKGPSRFQNLDEIRVLNAKVLDEPEREDVLLRETRYSEVFLLRRA